MKSLHASKGFYKGSRLPLTVLKHPYPKSMKIYEIIKNLSKSMKSLHSSKGFYRGSKLPLTVLKHQHPKSMKIHEIIENLWKSTKSLHSDRGFYRGSRLPLTVLKHPCPKCMKLYEIIESRKIYENLWKAYIRAKVSLGEAGCLLPSSNIHTQNPWESMKSSKIHENPTSEQRFLWGQQQVVPQCGPRS